MSRCPQKEMVPCTKEVLIKKFGISTQLTDKMLQNGVDSLDSSDPQIEVLLRQMRGYTTLHNTIWKQLEEMIPGGGEKVVATKQQQQQNQIHPIQDLIQPQQQIKKITIRLTTDQDQTIYHQPKQNQPKQNQNQNQNRPEGDYDDIYNEFLEANELLVKKLNSQANELEAARIKIQELEDELDNTSLLGDDNDKPEVFMQEGHIRALKLENDNLLALVQDLYEQKDSHIATNHDLVGVDQKDLLDQVEDLKTENFRLTRRLENSLASYHELQICSHGFQNERDNLRVGYAEVCKTNADLKRQIQQLQKQLQEKDQVSGATKKDLERQMEGIKKDLVNTHMELTQAKNTLRTDMTTRDKLHVQNAQLERQIGAMKGDIERLQQVIQEANQNYTNLERKNRLTEAEITRLRGVIETQGSYQLNETHKIQEELESVKLDLGEAKSTLIDLEGLYHRTVQERNDLRTRLAESQEDESCLRRGIDELMEEVRLLREEMDTQTAAAASTTPRTPGVFDRVREFVGMAGRAAANAAVFEDTPPPPATAAATATGVQEEASGLSFDPSASASSTAPPPSEAPVQDPVMDPNMEVEVRVGNGGTFHPRLCGQPNRRNAVITIVNDEQKEAHGLVCCGNCAKGFGERITLGWAQARVRNVD